jgi:hypothetical protein
MKTSFLPSGEGNGSKFWAWVICTGIEIGLSAAAAARSRVSHITKRSEKKIRGKKEELRREVMTPLLAMNLSLGAKESKGQKAANRKALSRCSMCDGLLREAQKLRIAVSNRRHHE